MTREISYLLLVASDEDVLVVDDLCLEVALRNYAIAEIRELGEQCLSCIV